MMRFVALLVCLSAASWASAQKITLEAVKHDEKNVVVTAPLPDKESSFNAITLPDGKHTPAQSVDGKLIFVLPELKAGKALSHTPTTLNYVKAPPHYDFKVEGKDHVDVLFDGKPELRFVNRPHDSADHYYTFKPFHQVFDPATGKILLSSGSYKKASDGKFPHHRGLFFGFNRISYGDKKTADIWHGTKNVYSAADKMLKTVAGEVLAQQSAAISWHGSDDDTFATETRTVTVYHTNGGILLDWSTELTTKLDKVRLDGDPQHAGFHFRATQEVSSSTAKETYYLRPDGKGKPGETRNWDAKGKNPITVNLPWNAMSFVTHGKRYTALRINHPDNPKETRGSERDYGRFGDYFEYDLTPSHPLKLKYRVWVQEGEMTVEQCNAMAAAFVHPPEARLSK